MPCVRECVSARVCVRVCCKVDTFQSSVELGVISVVDFVKHGAKTHGAGKKESAPIARDRICRYELSDSLCM